MAQKRPALPELHFTSQAEIDKLRTENLQLRVKVFNLEASLSKHGVLEAPLTKLDSVQEETKVDKVDKICQTNLNSYSIDELVGDRVTLKRSSTKHLRADEKKLLEELYEINGRLTAARDILRAASDF